MAIDIRDALQVVWGLLFLYIVYVTVQKPAKSPKMRTVAVLVLGDVGRSPRMMYHAECFAKSGFSTVVIGYKGAQPIASLLSEPLVRLRYLPPLPQMFSALPFVLLAPLKIAFQITALFVTFFIRLPQPPEYIIVQNPPTIPTLAFVWVVGKLLGSKVIIDWHNLGFTILALKLGNSHPFVLVAKKFEAFFGRTAYAHLFVTRAMHDKLAADWKLQGHKVILHDRPPAHFHRTSPGEAHELFLRLEPILAKEVTLKGFLPESSSPYSTPFTHISSLSGAPLPGAPSANSLTSAVEDPLSTRRLAAPEFRPDRPALLVSSTSWTPDEDFSLLLRALEGYEQSARDRDSLVLKGTEGVTPLPKILVIVTGRGPQREEYMERIKRLHEGRGEDGKQDKNKAWKWVRCISVWLAADDYPLLLGSANLGVSLHSSSSALDLPMKIVDMFGCGLPVCALDFACLDELVQDGKNGLVFSNAEQLKQQLQSLLSDFPKQQQLKQLSDFLEKRKRTELHLHRQEDGWTNWAENWDSVMKPLVSADSDRYVH